MATLTASAGARRVRQQGIPWYVWCAALAVTSVTIGAHWDVSWHRSIGRDSFWTPAHLAIYACGVLAGISCGYLVLKTTVLRPPQMVAASVSVFGLRGPLGAFLAAWGGVAMLTSAPFDNWWHNAYGLDVKIVSPPHTLLMLGIWAVAVGALFLLVAEMNRAEGALFRRMQWLLLYVSGLMLVLSMFFRMEYTWDVKLHNAGPYISVALGVPLYYAMVWWASRNRWACTWTTLLYTFFMVGLILVLPLFPAQPKLGPVYQQVTQFIPPKFPMLLIVPAVALDLLWSKTRARPAWLVGLLSGPAFVLAFVAVEWPFATFLMSKASEDRFFGTMYHDYGTPSWSYEVLRRFWMPEHGLVLWEGLALAMLYAAISTWLGIGLGRWMQKIQR